MRKSLVLALFLIFVALFVVGCQYEQGTDDLDLTSEEAAIFEDDSAALAGQATASEREVCKADAECRADVLACYRAECADLSGAEQRACVNDCFDAALDDECVPYECVYQDYAGGIKDCGIIDDGCGGTVNCNYQQYAGGLECPTGYECVNQEYAGGIQHQCVATDTDTEVDLTCDMVLSHDESVTIGGTSFTYLAADDRVTATPRVRWRNDLTREVIDLAVTFAGEEGSFTLHTGGHSYNFVSTSDTSLDDWDIRYVCSGSSSDLEYVSTGVNTITKRDGEVVYEAEAVCPEGYQIISGLCNPQNIDGITLDRQSISEFSNSMNCRYHVNTESEDEEEYYSGLRVAVQAVCLR